jgi:hypothetical protein
MKKLLVIEAGSSRTSAILLEYIATRIVRSEEFVCGSNQLAIKNTFNSACWESVLNQLLGFFRRNNNLKNCAVILSLPRGIITYEHELSERSKRNLLKTQKEKQKKTKDLVLSPLCGEQEIFWPLLSVETYKQIFSSFRSARLKLQNIFPALPGLARYAEVPNFALINLGGRGTDIMIFQQKELRQTTSLPIGGEHVIHDISIVQRLREDESRNIFFRFDRLFESYFNKTDDLLVKIIDQRIAELFRLLKAELTLPLETIYICGGLANCAKLPEYLESFLKTKVVNLNEKVSEHSFLFLPCYAMAEQYLQR